MTVLTVNQQPLPTNAPAQSHRLDKITLTIEGQDFYAQKIIVTASSGSAMSNFENEVNSLAKYSATSVIVSDELLKTIRAVGAQSDINSESFLVISSATYQEIISDDESNVFAHEAEHARTKHAAKNGSAKAIAEMSCLSTLGERYYEVCPLNEIQARLVQTGVITRQVEQLEELIKTYDPKDPLGDLEIFKINLRITRLNSENSFIINDTESIFKRFEQFSDLVAEKPYLRDRLVENLTEAFLSNPSDPEKLPSVSVRIDRDDIFKRLDLKLPPTIEKFREDPELVKQIIAKQLDLFLEQIQQQGKVIAMLDKKSFA